jgi:hypothetical protein
VGREVARSGVERRGDGSGESPPLAATANDARIAATDRVIEDLVATAVRGSRADRRRVSGAIRREAAAISRSE